jgi:hypothetical protein
MGSVDVHRRRAVVAAVLGAIALVVGVGIYRDAAITRQAQYTVESREGREHLGPRSPTDPGPRAVE